MRIGTGIAALGAALLLSAAGAIPAAAAPARAATIQLTGAVADPAGYTAAAVAALPQLSYPEPDGRTVTGANLEDLVNSAAPVLPAGKNTSLRVVVTVTGRGHRSTTLALGELDPSFGNHPAVLTVEHGSVDLVVPGDRLPVRSVSGVEQVRVAVSAAGVVTPPTGGIEVIAGRRTVTLSAARLARLPRQTESVTFYTGTTPETHTESGPPLALVLLTAGVLAGPNTAVVGVGDDNYGAAVTLGETFFGGRPLLLSTVEDGAALPAPRLVAVGDVKGGRDVSGLVELTVG
jgi:hypothetical protein